MKRQTQKTGVRTYFGDDLVELQAEPLHAIDAMLAASGECVVSGCAIEAVGDKYNIAPGYVAINTIDQQSGISRIMVMPFAGVTDVTLPIYLTASVDVVERAYGDGSVKPIAYSYKAAVTAIKPTDKTSIEITAAYTRRLSDALAESLTAYIAVTATEKAVWNAKETPTGAQAKADAAKTTAIADAKKYTDDNKYIHPSDANTRHVTDAEKAAWDAKASNAVATTSANGLMAAADKTKLNAIAAGANYYVHPNNSSTRHVTDAEKEAWGSKADGRIFKPTGIDLPPTAVINMPGVLCAGSVNWGMVDKSWGCKSFRVEKHNGLAGNYKITHNIGHLDYFITANIHSSVNGFSGYANIAEKTSNSVIVVTKNYETIADTIFDFMICGRN